jgi:hypothetical protein
MLFVIVTRFTTIMVLKHSFSVASIYTIQILIEWTQLLEMYVNMHDWE